MSNCQELEQRYFLSTVKRLPLTLVRGEGMLVWDKQGKHYLDFVGGWGVDSLGHCHPAVVHAVASQAGTLIQVSNHYYTIPQIELARLLVENSCLDKVFLCNSGAEANEGAVKLARRYGRLHLGGAYEVITAENSFHGRTLAMVAASGQKKLQEPYTPLPAGFVNVPFDDIEAIQKATTKDTCAVMLELVQGEGGVNIPAEGYLRHVSDWCQQKGMLLILDEIQTGIGRLGKLFGYELFGVQPDIITLAKGLGGGIPIAAFLAKERAAVFSPGEHGSTFGGNPVACAAAHATLKFIIENDIPRSAGRMGHRLLDGLGRLKAKYDFVVDARGCGLLAALEFDRDLSDAVVRACIEGGLLVNPVKLNAIRFMPPLIVQENEVDEALRILDGMLANLAAG
ncbi:aspartate aminotransferase family protein [Chloroflexota bacterium]